MEDGDTNRRGPDKSQLVTPCGPLICGSWYGVLQESRSRDLCGQRESIEVSGLVDLFGDGHAMGAG